MIKKQNKNLYHLLQLCQFSDSALPIGSFVFSNGLESAIQMGIVHDEKTLKDYILVILKQSATLDGIYINHAFTLAKNNQLDALLSLNESHICKRVGKEQQAMSHRIGHKLATLFLNIEQSKLLDSFINEIKSVKGMVSHPVVHGIIFNQLKLTQAEAFAIYHYGSVSMILSAAMRLMKIDHYQTQRILFEVNETVDDHYSSIINCTIDETSSFAPIYDCLLAQHVNAHVRMFMN